MGFNTGPQLKINLATANERDWAADLMASSEPWTTLNVSKEKCLIVCRDPEYLLYIAHADGRPSGFIILHPHGLAGSPYIKSIAVEERARSHGIGRAMIEFSENLFRSESKHIFLCVSSFNARAQLLYERLGFQKVGEFKDYVVTGE